MRQLKSLSVISIFIVALSATGFSVAADKKKDYIPVSWNQLVPADYDSEALENELISRYDTGQLEDGSPAADALIGELLELQSKAPMTKEYDGLSIKIPGFVVPLGFEAQRITEFLLVPYYGACIHTPPPPPNQIIYVMLEEGVKMEDVYDPIYVNGLMLVERQDSEMGTAGYTVYADSIESYY